VLHQVGVSFDLYYDARKHKVFNFSFKIPYKQILHSFQLLHSFRPENTGRQHVSQHM